MNLETKLNNSLDNILRSSGYVFEIINRNKKNSNLIIGPNNQLINSKIVDHLSSSLKNFDDILDETIGKFNDAKWCIEQIVENKLRQEEMKLKEESDRKLREEQERVRKEEERKQEARRAEERKKEEEAAEEKRKQEAARKSKRRKID